MQDYAIQRSTRKCYQSNRPLEAGERYVSAIVQKGSELLRRDYSLDHWQGPTEETVGWWKTAIPLKKSLGPQLAPPLVLVDTLEALLDTPGQEMLAYVMALLLVRRRILVDQSNSEEDPSAEATAWELKFPADDRVLVVPIQVVARDRAGELQNQLLELLYTED